MVRNFGRPLKVRRLEERNSTPDRLIVGEVKPKTTAGSRSKGQGQGRCSEIDLYLGAVHYHLQCLISCLDKTQVYV